MTLDTTFMISAKNDVTAVQLEGSMVEMPDGRKGLLINCESLSKFNVTQLDKHVGMSSMKNYEHLIERVKVDNKTEYRCKWDQQCGYTSVLSHSMVRHMRKHTGEKPFKCWFCSYATVQGSHLKKHLLTHSGEKPFNCKFAGCILGFSRLKALKRHEREHTGRTKRPKDDTAGIAKNAKREENSITRYMHMVRKTIEGNHQVYWCEWINCTFKSARSDSMVRHIRSHTGDKPFRCHFCPYSTLQQCTLNRHIRKHDKDVNLALGSVVTLLQEEEGHS